MSATARDPHHGGIEEWKYENDRFYKRMVGRPDGKWHLVKRFHATPARIRLLHSLLPQPAPQPRISDEYLKDQIKRHGRGPLT